MKVRDLIALLQQQPQDATVVVDGYEGGYDDPVVHYGVAWLRQPIDQWCGDHGTLEAIEEDGEVGSAPSAAPVVVVSRNESEDYSWTDAAGREHGPDNAHERTWEAAQALAARWRGEAAP